MLQLMDDLKTERHPLLANLSEIPGNRVKPPIVCKFVIASLSFIPSQLLLGGTVGGQVRKIGGLPTFFEPASAERRQIMVGRSAK